MSVPLHLADLKRRHHGRSCCTPPWPPATAGERFRARDAAARCRDHFEADGFFDVQACNDTNRVDILVLGNERHAMVIARLDNLGKGASGAAVQSMNVHLGVDESLGL